MMDETRDKDGDIVSRLSTSDFDSLRSAADGSQRWRSASAARACRLSAAGNGRAPPETAERRPAGSERERERDVDIF